MEKKLYSAPVAKIHELTLEENFLQSGDGTWDNSIRQGTVWSNDPDVDYGMEE